METTQILDMNLEITGTYRILNEELVCNKVFHNEIIAGSNFENTVFENVVFDGCTFQGTEITRCKFIDCKFKNCNFNFTKFKDCSFIACKTENCHFCITNSLNCNFLSCTYIDNSSEGSKLEGSFLNCHLTEEEIKNLGIEFIYEASTLSSTELHKA